MHHHETTTRRAVSRRCARQTALALVLAVTSMLLLPTTATAEGTPEAAVVRWAVTPVDSSGEDDGRASIEHALDAGERVTDQISVQNLGDQEETFRLSAADGFTTSSGRFDMLASDQESTDAGTWIEISDEVTVPAGESVVVPFTITVPAHAEPGDHAAGVAASVITQQVAEDGTSLGIESRVGVKVITRVAGELAPAISVSEVSTTYHGSWNPFRAGQIRATFEVTNVGNTRLGIAGSASAGTGEISFPSDGEPIGELLQGDSRQVSFLIDGVWPTFSVPGELIVAPDAAVLGGTAPTVDQANIPFRTWAVPWPQLLVLLALALLLVALTGGRRRSRHRLAALLDQAREEGRRSAEPEGSEDSGQPLSVRRARAPLAALALTALGAAALALLAPAAASAADPDGGTDGAGLHVTITDLDSSPSTPPKESGGGPPPPEPE